MSISCVENSYFQVEGQIYKQISGLPSGRVLSPLFRNIYMDYFEQLALSNFNNTLICWFRFLDDISCIWEDIRLQYVLLNNLNSLRTIMQFTLKLKINYALLFWTNWFLKVHGSLSKMYIGNLLAQANI